MAIQIEDGTGVADAVSFATAAELTTFATARGFDLPEGDTEKEQLLVKAGDYMLGLEPRLKGTRTTATQRLPFPRHSIPTGFAAGSYYGPDTIPPMVKEAQMRLAVSGHANGGVLRPDGAGREVVMKKTGPLETEYAKQGSGTIQPQFNAAMDLLKPFLKPNTIIVERA